MKIKLKHRKEDPTGRLDILAQGLLEQGLREYANPAVRVGMKVLGPQVEEALRETLGPGTAGHEIAQRLTKAFREVQAEDSSR